MLKTKIFRTGLAVMLAGLFFMFLVPVQQSIAIDKIPLESDSAIIARHELEVLRGESIEEFSEHSFNSHLTREQLDSILWADERSRLIGSVMTWAPDSSFRICTVEMEGCGAYCNRWWTSWLHFNDGTGLVISDVPFEHIINISKMGDGKYLILETSYGRSGVYSCRSDGAYLFSLKDHQLITHPFPDPFRSGEQPSNSFGVGYCSYFGDPTDASLVFNKVNNTLTYHCAEDVGLYSQPDSISVYDGILTYLDTGFVIKKATETRIKFDAAE